MAYRHLQRAQSLYKFANEGQLKTMAALQNALHNANVVAEQAIVPTRLNKTTSNNARKPAANPANATNNKSAETDNSSGASGKSLNGLLARLRERLAELGRSR